MALLKCSHTYIYCISMTVTLYYDGGVPSPPFLNVVENVMAAFWPWADIFLQHDSIVLI